MLLANGVRPPIELADAEDAVEVLVALKRALPYSIWCRDPVDVELDRLDALF